MLSRSAAGLYWMGRYLERASHLSRLLRQQTSPSSTARPETSTSAGTRIYGALDREPLSGALELNSDDLFTLVDSFTLTDDLTFEPTNPDSIRSCFAQGRENAHQMRHHISAEMWTCLNQSYLRLQNMEMQDIWLRSPENFYAETAAQIDTFRGVTSSTLYRDDAWHFFQLGNYIERIQLSASLLMAQIAAVRLFEVPADVYWTSLLRHYHAFDAYNRASSAAIEPDRVLGLLVTHPQLPDSNRETIPWSTFWRCPRRSMTLSSTSRAPHRWTPQLTTSSPRKRTCARTTRTYWSPSPAPGACRPPTCRDTCTSPGTDRDSPDRLPGPRRMRGHSLAPRGVDRPRPHQPDSRRPEIRADSGRSRLP